MKNEPPLRAPSGHKMEVALARRKPPPVSSPGSSSSDSLPKPPPIRKAKRVSAEPESQRKLSSAKTSTSSPRKSLATKPIVKPPSPGASRVGVGTPRPKPKPVRTKAAPVNPSSSSSSAPPSPVKPAAKSKVQSNPREASISPMKETQTKSAKRKSSVSPTKPKPLISSPSGSTRTKGATKPPANSPVKSSSKPAPPTSPPKPSYSSPTKPKSKTFSFLPSSPAREMSSSPPPEVPAFLFGEDTSTFSFESGAQKPKSKGLFPSKPPITSKSTSKSAPSKPIARPSKLAPRLPSPTRRQPVASSSKRTLDDLPPDTSSLCEESDVVDDENEESWEEDELPRPKPSLSRVDGNAASRGNETGIGGGKEENISWRPPHTSRPTTPRLDTQIRKPTNMPSRQPVNTPSRRLTKTPTQQPTVPRSPDHGRGEDGSDSDDPLAVPAQSEQFVVVNGTPAPKPKRLGGGPSATPSRSGGTPARNVGTPSRRAQDGIGTPSRRVDLRFATPTRRVGGVGTPIRSNLAGTAPLSTPSRTGKRPVGRPRKTPAPMREVIDISSDSE
ncbi:hypothetical protein CYLTODRAFT_186698 [Cylindrobasidium torrendii FP15055 ss-10]|uniref:Uncharacterized protein n=1 Tax=Cylindrobasidium torrendii FP15055 ss-10 TaxID=1314674 RepID=A0A0D7BL62_9AGAR|nr:hypothetical protein CYLTODRAFT_186698 [Cylindrobasidium torrendii FP15055 ss-10]